MGALSSIVNASAPSLYISLCSITFNPTVWNIIARNGIRSSSSIFTFGLVRDHLCQCALLDQPRMTLLPKPFATLVPVLIFIVGQVFVLTSTYALGITGTFLGNYSRILMNDRCHAPKDFPFNVLRDPTYVGGTPRFATTALWYERPTGLLITLYVYIVYLIALRYEG
ncbi:phospholipid methyltransferase-domain-containing protein [Pisolithus microcarpus]|nr:phospholipid methyltransferase-domain-containing protein [Pisolithus microcarpus]